MQPIFRIARIVLSLGIIAALAYLLWRERGLLLSALDMGAGDFAIITIFTFSAWLVTTWTQVIILGRLRTSLRFRYLLALHVATVLLNHLPLRAGSAYRAYMLNRRARLMYAHFGSFSVVNGLAMMIAAGIAGALAVASAHVPAGPDARLLLGGLALMALGAAIPALVPLPTFAERNRWVRFWNELVRGRDMILRYKPVFALLLGAHALGLSFAGLRFLGAYRSMDITLDPGSYVVLGCAAVLSLIVSFTPAGLGIREFTVGAVGVLVGVPMTTGVVAATVVRAVISLWTVLVGVPALLWLRHMDRAASAQELRDPA